MEFLMKLASIRAAGEHAVLVCFCPADDENAKCHLTKGCDCVEVCMPREMAKDLALGHDYVVCFVKAPDKKS